MQTATLIHVSDTVLSDCYKDAYGVRPRHYKEYWTENELEAEYRYLEKVCMANIAEEKIAEIKALKSFNKLIKETMEMGAPNRETVIRWLVEAEGLEFTVYDLEYFFWGYGLSYELQRKLAKKYSK